MNYCDDRIDLLWHSTIRTLPIPISLSITVDDGTWSTGDGHSFTTKGHGIKCGRVCEAKSRISSKGDYSPRFDLGKVNAAVMRGVNILKRDCRT